MGKLNSSRQAAALYRRDLGRKKQLIRRKELSRLSSARRTELIAEYEAAPPDQLLIEQHVAAVLQRSRAWVQLRRLTGGGPVFLKDPAGAVRYRKFDVEAYKKRAFVPYRSTSEYEGSAKRSDE